MLCVSPTVKGYLLTNSISLLSVEQIAVELIIHNILITAPAEILEKKCRPNHEGCEKMSKENFTKEIFTNYSSYILQGNDYDLGNQTPFASLPPNSVNCLLSGVLIYSIVVNTLSFIKNYLLKSVTSILNPSTCYKYI